MKLTKIVNRLSGKRFQGILTCEYCGAKKHAEGIETKDYVEETLPFIECDRCSKSTMFPHIEQCQCSNLMSQVEILAQLVKAAEYSEEDGHAYRTISICYFE